MRISKAVFPAAGLGTRFLPATKAQPKEMLPLVDKPLIQYVIEDDIIHSKVPCMRQMIDVFEKLQGSVIAACEVPHSEIHHYGVIAGTPVEGFGGLVYRVRDVVEKPPADQAPSNLAIIGRYILTPQIFGFLEKTRSGSGGEIQLTDGIRLLL